MKNTQKKTPAYHAKVKADKADKIYVDILAHLIEGKRYRDPNYSAAQLAADLGTDKRYLAAAIALGSGDNYNTLVNGFRLRDACKMLRSAHYANMTAEEIGLMAGFSSRQAFYLAFKKAYDTTPRQYRLTGTDAKTV